MVMGLDRRVVAVTDIGGTAVLALQGAATAVVAGLDIYGIFVLAFVTALGGGILRDVLLGQAPPAAFRSLRYAVTVVVAACIIMAVPEAALLSDSLEVKLLGALGLGLFTVAGTEKARDFGCRSFAAVMIGTISATGGACCATCC